MTQDQFIWWSGVFFLANVSLMALYIIYVLGRRMCELIDYTRWQRMLLPHVPLWKFARFMRQHFVEMVILGRTWDSVRSGNYSWHGTGDWRPRR